ncbi:oligosaccharide flippase family protein, partial [Photobacterium damselae]|nr:oligosaccharide flippase family protein [Photobacterium damselae]
MNIDKLIKKNVFKNVIYQIILIFSSFFQYPIFVNHMNKTELGVWFTIVSITSWFMILDLGIANGLRNKLVYLISKKNNSLIKSYLASAYFYFGLGLLFVWGLLVFLISMTDMNLLLGISYEVGNLNTSLIIIVTGVIFNLFFSISFSLSNALQNSSLINMKNMITTFLFTFSVFLYCLMYGEIGLLLLSSLFFIFHFSVNVIITLIIFTENKDYHPQFKYISYKRFKSNFNVGFGFFIINIASVALFSTDTLLITKLLGANHVVDYSIALKLYSVFLMILWLYTGPLWSAYSLKNIEGDFNWIKHTLKKTIILSFFLIFLILVTTILYKY